MVSIYIHIYIKFLKKVGLFGYRQGLLVGFGSGCGGVLRAGKTLFGIGCLIRPGFWAQKRNFSERLPSSQRWITQLKNRGLLCPSSQWLGNPFLCLASYQGSATEGPTLRDVGAWRQLRLWLKSYEVDFQALKPKRQGTYILLYNVP